LQPEAANHTRIIRLQRIQGHSRKTGKGAALLAAVLLSSPIVPSCARPGRRTRRFVIDSENQLSTTKISYQQSHSERVVVSRPPASSLREGAGGGRGGAQPHAG
jgi:hypothetical protein